MWSSTRAARPRLESSAYSGKQVSQGSLRDLSAWKMQSTKITAASLNLSLVVAGDICHKDMHASVAKYCVSEACYCRRKPKNPGAVDGINNVYATIIHTRTFGVSNAKFKKAEEFYQGMIKCYLRGSADLVLVFLVAFVLYSFQHF